MGSEIAIYVLLKYTEKQTKKNTYIPQFEASHPLNLEQTVITVQKC